MLQQTSYSKAEVTGALNYTAQMPWQRNYRDSLSHPRQTFNGKNAGEKYYLESLNGGAFKGVRK